MAVLPTLLQVGAVLALAWAALARYRDALVPPAVLAAVYCAWSLGLLGFLLLPLDITSNGLRSVSASASTASAQPPAAFLAAWELLYWLTFLFSWLLLPLLVELRLSGEFSRQARVLGALRRLALRWSALAAAALAGALYLLLARRWSLRGVAGLAMAAADAYGLLWLVALLGYGLADVPRSLWTLRSPARRLHQHYLRAVQLHAERMEAVFSLDAARADVSAASDRLRQAESAAIVLSSDLQRVKPCLAQLAALAGAKDAAPRATATATAAKRAGASGHARGRLRPPAVAAPTLREVVALHRRVREAQLERRRCEQAWLDLCERAAALQAQVAAREAAAEAPAAASAPRQALARALAAAEEPARAACAAVAAAASLCVLWSELTMGWRMPQLSLFRSVLARSRAAAANGEGERDGHGAAAAELLALALLAYMAACAYASALQLRGGALGRPALVARGNSTELCLLRASTLLCRLQFSLARNVLLLLNAREVTDRTAFHLLFDRARAVHGLGHGVAVYAPALMALLVALTLADAHARVLAALGLEQYEQLALGGRDADADADADAGRDADGGGRARRQALAVAKGEQLVLAALERHRALLARRKRARDARGVYGFSPTETAAQALLADDADDDGGADDDRGRDGLAIRTLA